MGHLQVQGVDIYIDIYVSLYLPIDNKKPSLLFKRNHGTFYKEHNGHFNTQSNLFLKQPVTS